MLWVNLTNYTNPSGLCAECQIQNTSNPLNESLGPVCCDEMPYNSYNCNNTGDARCDTRFRWTIRPHGALWETRPNMSFVGFTDCTLSPSTCPFSEMSATFSQGAEGILGVTDNPIIINSSNLHIINSRPAIPVCTCVLTPMIFGAAKFWYPFPCKLLVVVLYSVIFSYASLQLYKQGIYNSQSVHLISVWSRLIFYYSLSSEPVQLQCYIQKKQKNTLFFLDLYFTS